MTFRAITGEFRDITGELLANTTIDVTPKYHISGDGSSVAILGDTTPVTSNGSGVATVNLADNILYEIEYTTSRGTQSREMFVDDEGPWTWGRLIGLAGNIGASILRQAVDARDDAQAAQASAAASSAAAGAASGRLDIELFSDLATKFVYADPGSGQQVAAPGDVVLWRGEGVAYLVLASGASGAHFDYTGAGGVKLQALPCPDGWYSAVALNLTDGNDAASRLAAFVTAGLHKIRVPCGQSVAIDTLCTIDAQGIDLHLDGHFDCSGGGRISIEGAHSALPALASTVTKGVAKTFTFASAHGLAVGDHVCFWDETDFSAGLARYYYRQGWRALVATVPTSTTATFFGTLPIDLDHTVMNCAKVTGERVTLPPTCRFTPATGETNPAVQIARQKFANVRAQVDNGAAYQAIAVTQCYNVVSRDPAATVVDGDAYPINVSCCGGGRLESVALFSDRHAEAIGGGGSFDSFAGNTPMRDFIVVNSTLRSSGQVGAADAHGATFNSRFVNCIMDAGWALGGGDNVGVDCTIICNGEFGLRMTEVDGGVIRLENPHFITYGAQSEGTIYIFPGFLSRDLTLIVNNPTFEHRGGATDQVRPFAIHALSTNDWDVSAGAPPSPSHLGVYKVTVGGTYDGHTYSVDDLAIYTSYGPSGGKVVPISEHSVDVVVTGPKVVGTLTSVTFVLILGTRDVSALYSFSMDDISGPGGTLFYCSEAANYNMPLRMPRQTVRGTLSLTTAGTSAITGLLNFPWAYPAGREPDCVASWHLSATGSMTAAQEEVDANVWQRTREYARVSLRREGGAAFGSDYDAVVTVTASVDDL